MVMVTKAIPASTNFKPPSHKFNKHEKFTLAKQKLILNRT